MVLIVAGHLCILSLSELVRRHFCVELSRTSHDGCGLSVTAHDRLLEVEITILGLRVYSDSGWLLLLRKNLKSDVLGDWLSHLTL